MQTGITIFLLLVHSIFGFHPVHVSNTEIKYNPSRQALEISCRMNTNDLENALKKYTGQPIYIFGYGDTLTVKKQLSEYLVHRFIISIDGQKREFDFLGYEKEEEATWCYMEITGITTINKLELDNRLLFETLHHQTNIVHADINGTRQSNKVTNPDSKMIFLK